MEDFPKETGQGGEEDCSRFRKLTGGATKEGREDRGTDGGVNYGGKIPPPVRNRKLQGLGPWEGNLKKRQRLVT